MLKKENLIEDEVLDQVTGGGRIIPIKNSNEGRPPAHGSSTSTSSVVVSVTFMYCSGCGHQCAWSGDYLNITCECPNCHAMKLTGYDTST